MAMVAVMPRVDDVEVPHPENSFSLEDSDFSPPPHRVIEIPIWQSSQKSPYLALFGADGNGKRQWHFSFASRLGLSTLPAGPQVPE